jgi:hypothetical protein
MGVKSWSFLTNHARVLLRIAGDPGARLRDIAAGLGSPSAARTASSRTWPRPGTSSSRKTAAVTATRSKRTSRCQIPLTGNQSSATSWPC